MAITFKADILKHDQRKDGTWNVKIRITKDRAVVRIPTNYYVSRPYLSRKYEITDLDTLKSCQAIIDDFRAIINRLGDDVDTYDAKSLAKYLVEEKAKKAINNRIDFIAFAENHVEKLKGEGRTGYAASIRSTILWLKKHYDTLSISRITVRELENMQVKMLETMSQTSANIHLRNIRTLFNNCADSMDDDDIIKHYPFRRFKFRKDDVPKKRNLDIETLRKIIFFPEHHLKRVNFARDIFTLSFALLGMNTKDLYTCSDFDGERIVYMREKTKRKGEKARTAPRVADEVNAIFERYRDPEGRHVFNFYKQFSTSENFYKAINKGLQVICKEAGIPSKVTTYYCRHSFASIARNDCGVDKYDVSVCLTHSSGLDITDRYINEDWGTLDRVQRKVLDLVFKEQ